MTTFVEVATPGWMRTIRRRRYRRYVAAVLAIAILVVVYALRVTARTDEPEAWLVFAGVIFVLMSAVTASRLRSSVTKERMVERLAHLGVEPERVGWCVQYDESLPRDGRRAYVVLEPGRLRFFDDGDPFDRTSGPPELFEVSDADVVMASVSRGLLKLGSIVELHRDRDPSVRLWAPASTLALLQQHYGRRTEDE